MQCGRARPIFNVNEKRGGQVLQSHIVRNTRPPHEDIKVLGAIFYKSYPTSSPKKSSTTPKHPSNSFGGLRMIWARPQRTEHERILSRESLRDEHPILYWTRRLPHRTFMVMRWQWMRMRLRGVKNPGRGSAMARGVESRYQPNASRRRRFLCVDVKAQPL